MKTVVNSRGFLQNREILVQLSTNKHSSGYSKAFPQLVPNLLVLCFEVKVTMTVANMSSPIDGADRISVYASMVTMWVVVH